MIDIKKMSIADVLDTEEWKKNITNTIEKVEKMHLLAMNTARKANTRLKRSPLDRLIEKDILGADFTRHYTEVLEKTSKLSSVERAAVFTIGMQAYNATMRELTKDKPELLNNETTKD